MKRIIKDENIFLKVAVFFVFFALLSPITVYFISNISALQKIFSNIGHLGPVGDFIGGTTIALFNIASFSMLVATLIMQKEELKLQREEITKTRQEYELTNKTMKKQQFESTFFNMLSLHQNISKDIIQKKEVFEHFFRVFKNKYEERLTENVNREFRSRLFLKNRDKKSLLKVLEKIYVAMELKEYMDEESLGTYGMELTPDQYKGYMYTQIHDWITRYKERCENEFQRKYTQNDNYKEFIGKIDFQKLIGTEDYISNELVIEQFESYRIHLSSLNYELKVDAYEQTYLEFEEKIGHYYRNLYRIEKLLAEQGFSFEDRSNYRGIWRAQLSSSELLMLYYNVNFSEKGEKFKTLLLNTGFFDDHIKSKDLIWSTDHELLAHFMRRGS